MATAGEELEDAGRVQETDSEIGRLSLLSAASLRIRECVDFDQVLQASWTQRTR